MKYYYRKVKRRYYDYYYRTYQYKIILEVVYTDNIDLFNKRKRIKFEEMGLNTLEDHTLYHKLKPNLVYCYDVDW